MRRKNYKGRCEKRSLSICAVVCKSYDALQFRFADLLQDDETIGEFRCNVLLDGLEYTSDFVCTKVSGDLMVRECVQRSHLTKPMTGKLLDISREYWRLQGVTDWGLVIDAEE